jgi:hypothetical protein
VTHNAADEAKSRTMDNRAGKPAITPNKAVLAAVSC